MMSGFINANSLNIPLADKSVHMAVTSPPYYSLRDYEVDGQIGLESTPEEYIDQLVNVFREVKRVLRDDGTLWVNIGDTYAGSGGAGGDYNAGGRRDGQPRYKSNFVIDKSKRNSSRWGGGNAPATGTIKPKDMIGIPWMLAFSLRADGWWLRQEIIWNKTNPMTESVKDRCTKSHEQLFLLSKSQVYYFDNVAIEEPANQKEFEYRNRVRLGKIYKLKSLYSETDNFPFIYTNTSTRNRRSVWSIPVARYKGAHFATYPEKLVEPCVLAGTSEKGVCPECGAPWVRIIKKDKPDRHASENQTIGSGRGDKGDQSKHADVTPSITVGWEAGCFCGAGDPVPAIVLDPFSGAGTTSVVCNKKNRTCIGLELSLYYIQQSKQRISKGIQKSLL